jgi:hypothetical protein
MVEIIEILKMVLKSYSVSLESDYVNRALKIIKYKNIGGKLSPVVNDLIKKWVESEEKNRK